MNWLSQNSAAVQAFSAVAIAVLTLVLIFITHRYVKSTQAMVHIMERDSAIRLRPQVVPTINYKWEHGKATGSFRLANPGPNDAVLRRVELDVYCLHAEICERLPAVFQLLTWRVLPPGGSVEQEFSISPGDICYFHEDHEGDCGWTFKINVECTDALHLLEHNYLFDEVLGIHCYSVLPSSRATKYLSAKNRLRNYSYRLRYWWKRLSQREVGGTF